MPTSVRVDEETNVLLERAVRMASTTKSKLIRKAVRQYCEKIVLGHTASPYESIEKFIGCADGPPDLSRHARQYLQEALRDKARRRAR